MVLEVYNSSIQFTSMPVAFASIPSVISDTKSATAKFIQRLFLKTTEIYTWQNTLLQMNVNTIPQAFADANDVFVEFVTDPTKEKFDAWGEKLALRMEEDGVTDDWNASALFMALIMAKFRDLNIAGPIEPFENVKDVCDAPFADPTAGLCPRAFATVVFGVAELANRTPTMVQIAEAFLDDVEQGDGESNNDDKEEDE